MTKESLPNFDENGNMPPGCHHCHINEFEKKFVDFFKESISRRSRFKGFIKYSHHICSTINRENKFIMNGSYTTTKNNPNDIDFLIVFNASQINNDEYDFSINKLKEYKNLKSKNKKRADKMTIPMFYDLYRFDEL